VLYNFFACETQMKFRDFESEIAGISIASAS